MKLDVKAFALTCALVWGLVFFIGVVWAFIDAPRSAAGCGIFNRSSNHN